MGMNRFRRCNVLGTFCPSSTTNEKTNIAKAAFMEYFHLMKRLFTSFPYSASCLLLYSYCICAHFGFLMCSREGGKDGISSRNMSSRTTTLCIDSRCFTSYCLEFFGVVRALRGAFYFAAVLYLGISSSLVDGARAFC